MNDRNTSRMTIDQTTTYPRLLLSARDAAKALSIGTRKLWELTNCKAIPCVRIGKRVLYDPADLREFIDSLKEVRR